MFRRGLMLHKHCLLTRLLCFSTSVCILTEVYWWPSPGHHRVQLPRSKRQRKGSCSRRPAGPSCSWPRLGHRVLWPQAGPASQRAKSVRLLHGAGNGSAAVPSVRPGGHLPVMVPHCAPTHVDVLVSFEIRRQRGFHRLQAARDTALA